MNRPFPLPVVAAFVGPGSQADDDGLACLPMPQGMDTYRPPRLPERDDFASCPAARRVLGDALALLDRTIATGPCGAGEAAGIDLTGVPGRDLDLVNQLLGEGEVGAIVGGGQDGNQDEGLVARVQESVFPGVWRVVCTRDGAVVGDTLEVGAVPGILSRAAAADVADALADWPGPVPPEVRNAPSLVAEIEGRCRTRRDGEAAHVVNLTLLPMSSEDIAYLDHRLGTGRVTILSRGYGNCRITNTRRPGCWRVVYYNSQDVVILNTVEVTDLPDVAQASPEDLVDSASRLREVLSWMDGP